MGLKEESARILYGRMGPTLHFVLVVMDLPASHAKNNAHSWPGRFVIRMVRVIQQRVRASVMRVSLENPVANCARAINNLEIVFTRCALRAPTKLVLLASALGISLVFVILAYLLFKAQHALVCVSMGTLLGSFAYAKSSGVVWLAQFLVRETGKVLCVATMETVRGAIVSQEHATAILLVIPYGLARRVQSIARSICANRVAFCILNAMLKLEIVNVRVIFLGSGQTAL